MQTLEQRWVLKLDHCADFIEATLHKIHSVLEEAKPVRHRLLIDTLLDALEVK